MSIDEFSKIIFSRFLRFLAVFIAVRVASLFLLPWSWNDPRVQIFKFAEGTIHIEFNSKITRGELVALGLSLIISFRQIKTVVEATKEFLTES